MSSQEINKLRDMANFLDNMPLNQEAIQQKLNNYSDFASTASPISRMVGDVGINSSNFWNDYEPNEPQALGWFGADLIGAAVGAVVSAGYDYATTGDVSWNDVGNDALLLGVGTSLGGVLGKWIK